jgi:hypothetical protein
MGDEASISSGKVASGAYEISATSYYFCSDWSSALHYEPAIGSRSVKVRARKVRVAHIEHFAFQAPSAPQWPIESKGKQDAVN